MNESRSSVIGHENESNFNRGYTGYKITDIKEASEPTTPVSPK